MVTKWSRFYSGLMEAAWLAAVSLIPIFFNVYSNRIFEPDKISLLRSLALLSLGAWLLKLIEEGGRSWKTLSPKESFFKYLWHFPLAAPVFGLIIVYLVSTFFSVTPAISFFGSYQRLQGTYTTFSYLIIFLSIVTNMRTRSQVNRFITTVIIASLPITLYGLLQKYQIDPIPWGGNVSVRIAANLGNSIFVAAYLIMVFPLTIGRIISSFKEILLDDSGNDSRLNGSRQIIKATIYIFIAALQLIAIYLSGSRGPMLGLFTGSYLLLLLLSIYWNKRWLTTIIVGFGIVGVLFLAIFNLPNSPFEALKKSTAIGRFGRLLDPESNSALVRQYIWEGTVDLVSIHQPLKFPDGSEDKYNFLRPFIGYGPESMYVAYNQFYQPDLGQVEKRNASPDRAHNETWDSVVITGITGLFIYLTIFTSIFYFGLKWLGFIPSERNKKLFVILLVIGGLTGTLTFSYLKGVEFLGIGLPLGLLFSVIIYLTGYALIKHKITVQAFQDSQYQLFLIVLFAAFISHFIEINFGIAIVATRMLFWSYAGVMVVIGFILPHLELTDSNTKSVDHPEDSKSISKELKKGNRHQSRSQKLNGRNLRPIFAEQPDWIRNALIGAVKIGLLLATFGYLYLTNSSQNNSIFTILINSFTRLRDENSSFSPGILVLITVTWLIGSLLVYSERDGIDSKNDYKYLGIVLVGSLLIGSIFWIIHSILLTIIAGFIPETQNDVLTQVNNIGSLLTNYYLFIFISIIFLAFLLQDSWRKKYSMFSGRNLILFPIMLILLFFLVRVTNLLIINADITFKTAEPFTKSGQWQVVTYLYKRSIELSPKQDHYYLFLGQSYLEQAKMTQTIVEQDSLVAQAEKDLRIAQSINPLNTDHTANLARLYRWWASNAKNNDDLIARGNKASEFYASAVTLSPNSSTLWDEWAILYMQILGDNQEALRRLQHAISLDDQYSFTLGLFGEYYLWVANSLDEPAIKISSYENAVRYYQRAAEVAKKTDTTSKATFMMSLGNTYIILDELDSQDNEHRYLHQATQVISSLLDTNVNPSEIWKVQEVMAKIYLKLGDKLRASEYANLALNTAPVNFSSRIQDLINQIEKLP